MTGIKAVYGFDIINTIYLVYIIYRPNINVEKKEERFICL